MDDDPRNLSAADLLRRAMDDVRGLVQAEIRQAKEELRKEARRALRAGILLGTALVLTFLGLSVLLVTLGLALPWGRVGGTGVVGGILVLVAAACAYLGVRAWPRRILPRTREHISRDFRLVKEARS